MYKIFHPKWKEGEEHKFEVYSKFKHLRRIRTEPIWFVFTDKHRIKSLEKWHIDSNNDIEIWEASKNIKSLRTSWNKETELFLYYQCVLYD